jgi:hypothetical protein
MRADVSYGSNIIQTRGALAWVRCDAHLRESAARFGLQRYLLPVKVCGAQTAVEVRMPSWRAPETSRWS